MSVEFCASGGNSGYLACIRSRSATYSGISKLAHDAELFSFGVLLRPSCVSLRFQSRQKRDLLLFRVFLCFAGVSAVPEELSSNAFARAWNTANGALFPSKIKFVPIKRYVGYDSVKVWGPHADACLLFLFRLFQIHAFSSTILRAF